MVVVVKEVIRETSMAKLARNFTLLEKHVLEGVPVSNPIVRLFWNFLTARKEDNVAPKTKFTVGQMFLCAFCNEVTQEEQGKETGIKVIRSHLNDSNAKWR